MKELFGDVDRAVKKAEEGFDSLTSRVAAAEESIKTRYLEKAETSNLYNAFEFRAERSKIVLGFNEEYDVEVPELKRRQTPSVYAKKVEKGYDIPGIRGYFVSKSDWVTPVSPVEGFDRQGIFVPLSTRAITGVKVPGGFVIKVNPQKYPAEHIISNALNKHLRARRVALSPKNLANGMWVVRVASVMLRDAYNRWVNS